MRPLTSDTVLAIYGLHLMMRRDKPVSLGEIQRSGGFERNRIFSVLGKLRRSGLIRSQPGRGFLLAKAAGEITLENILQAVDPPSSPTAPCGGNFDACDVRGSCILAPLCRKAEQGFQETIRSFTLAELSDKAPELPLCMDPKLRAEAS
jgi:Rrf2 family protein